MVLVATSPRRACHGRASDPRIGPLSAPRPYRARSPGQMCPPHPPPYRVRPRATVSARASALCDGLQRACSTESTQRARRHEAAPGTTRAVAMAAGKYGGSPSFSPARQAVGNRVPAAGAFLGLRRDGAGDRSAGTSAVPESGAVLRPQCRDDGRALRRPQCVDATRSHPSPTKPRGELEARGLYRNLLVTGLLDQRGELARRRRVLSQCRTGQGILRSEERTG
jgi:hypothetical protein